MRKTKKFSPGHPSLFGLSRSKLENFMNCPRCFYLDRRLGIEPPSGPPFSINLAVDHLLKKEFDDCRVRGVPHPYIAQAGLDALAAAARHLLALRHLAPRTVRFEGEHGGVDVLVPLRFCQRAQRQVGFGRAHVEEAVDVRAQRHDGRDTSWRARCM